MGLQKKQRKIVEQSIVGVVDRIRERKKTRFIERNYYHLRRELLHQRLKGIKAAIRYLDWHSVLFQRDERLGFPRLFIGRFPALIFGADGEFVGYMREVKQPDPSSSRRSSQKETDEPLLFEHTPEAETELSLAHVP